MKRWIPIIALVVLVSAIGLGLLLIRAQAQPTASPQQTPCPAYQWMDQNGACHLLTP